MRASSAAKRARMSPAAASAASSRAKASIYASVWFLTVVYTSWPGSLVGTANTGMPISCSVAPWVAMALSGSNTRSGSSATMPSRSNVLLMTAGTTSGCISSGYSNVLVSATATKFTPSS